MELDSSWSIGGKPHGGYLLATAVGPALGNGHPHPLAVSAHYVRSPDAGAAGLSVLRLRTGRSVTSSRVSLSQDGRPCLEALLTAGRLPASGAAYWSAAPAGPPQLPPLEQCPRAPAVRADGTRIGQLDHVELRLDPATAGWMDGAPSGNAEIRAWLRRDDGRDPSVLDLLVFADSTPPVTFELGLMGWAPTVALTVSVRALPAPGWIRSVQRSRLLQDGWFDQSCELWDSADRLVATATQLGGYRLPRD